MEDRESWFMKRIDTGVVFVGVDASLLFAAFVDSFDFCCQVLEGCCKEKCASESSNTGFMMAR